MLNRCKTEFEPRSALHHDSPSAKSFSLLLNKPVGPKLGGVVNAIFRTSVPAAHDFTRQHPTDQKLPKKDLQWYTLLLAMSSWEFEALAAICR